MLFMVHGVQTQSYELLQMQVVLNTHLTLEFNSSLGLPVALNKHGRPVAGPSTATGDRTVALQLSHHYFTVVTKTDTSTQGEQEDSRVEHHGMVYTRSKHTATLQDTLFGVSILVTTLIQCQLYVSSATASCNLNE